MTKKRATAKKSVVPQSSSETTKAPMQGGTPVTGFGDDGAKGRGSKLMMGAAGPEVPANPRPCIH